MPRRPNQPDHDAAVLYATIGIEQSGSDGADVGPNRVRADCGQPALSMSLDVVVQKHKQVPAGRVRWRC